MAKIHQLLAAFFVSIVAMSCPASAQDWRYEFVQDKFNDQKSYIATARSFDPQKGVSMEMAFECRNGEDFVFTVDAGAPLAKKKRNFDVLIRVDERPTASIEMRAYTNSGNGGMHSAHAVDIVNAALRADTMLIRAISSGNDHYEAQFPMRDAIPSIVKVAYACNLRLAG